MKKRTLETYVICDDRDEPKNITSHDIAGQGKTWYCMDIMTQY